MLYRVSIFINTIISLIVLGLSLIAAFLVKQNESEVIVFVTLLVFEYGTFLVFDIINYRIIKLNKEHAMLTNGTKLAGRIFFVLSIAAVLTVLLITAGVGYSFFSETGSISEKLRPFYIGFIITQLLASATYVFVTIGYFRSLKENKTMLNTYINELGT